MGFSDNLMNYEVNSERVAWRQKPVLLEELISINNRPLTILCNYFDHTPYKYREPIKRNNDVINV
jgi:hypothetical protein